MSIAPINIHDEIKKRPASQGSQSSGGGSQSSGGGVGMTISMAQKANKGDQAPADRSTQASANLAAIAPPDINLVRARREAANADAVARAQPQVQAQTQAQGPAINVEKPRVRTM